MSVKEYMDMLQIENSKLSKENSQLKEELKSEKETRKKAIEYIKDTCYYPELDNISNMTSEEVEELLEILKGDNE